MADNVNEQVIQDKEQLEQKELERQSQAQKDRASFTFSWVAIIFRGIVGTCVSLFVFTQVHRIENENNMSKFILINTIHKNAIETETKDITNQLKLAVSLYNLEYSEGAISDLEFQKTLDILFKDMPEVSEIQWHNIKIDPKEEDKKHVKKAFDTGKIVTYFPTPENIEEIPKEIPLTYFIAIKDAGQKPLGYITATIELNKLFLNSIDPQHISASDIYVFANNPEKNDPLLFYFLPNKKDGISVPLDLSKLPKSEFSEYVEIPFGDKSLIFSYIATPEFTEYTWQAAIASSIGVFITSFIVISAWILLEIEKRQFSHVLHEGHIQEIEGTIDLLEITKNRLVAQENLASLGGLTAGIAHEIKNPLNFINNFSTLSIELVDNINKFAMKYKNVGTPEERDEIYESIATLKQNIETIHEQGKRADDTIQRMLAHSRGKSGEWCMTDIHKMLDEYINFSFHGMRAKNSNFNVKIEKKFESEIKEVKVVANDISRVLLNLLNNAFQAVEEKEYKMRNDYTDPTVTVKTEDIGNFLRIRIRDNGIGIEDKDKGKIFTPFFTTKPTGLGTGLGLSLSYNIIVREHGGSLTFESFKNEYTEFIITIPFQPKTEQEVINE